MTLALALGVELTSAFLGRKEGGGGAHPRAPTGGRDGAVPAE